MNVFRPIIRILSLVSNLNILRSPGKFQGSLPPTPITRLRAMAATTPNRWIGSSFFSCAGFISLELLSELLLFGEKDGAHQDNSLTDKHRTVSCTTQPELISPFLPKKNIRESMDQRPMILACLDRPVFSGRPSSKKEGNKVHEPHRL